MATCGEVLVKILENYGVDTVFGIPGVHTVELYRGLPDTGIRHITPRHEQGAGFMADGYARVTGKPGVCLIITGPGMTNIATAMGQALQDSIPMLVISSVNRSYQLGMGEGRLHELPNQRNTMAGVSVFSHTLLRADELPKVLARAFGVFSSQRPGPVHIEIPIDVITAEAGHLDTQAWNLPTPPAPSRAALDTAFQWLSEAEKPLLAVGGGAVGASDALAKLADTLGAPVVNTVNAKGLLPKEHPLWIGGSGSCPAVREAFRNADVVLAVGTEFAETDYDFFFEGNPDIPGKLIRVDIDADQLSRNVRSDLAIVADARLALEALNQDLNTLPLNNTHGEDRAAHCRDAIHAERDRHYELFFNTLQSALPGVVIAGDSTQPTYYAWLNYETEGPRRYFHSASGYGTLGYAIPAAIGAKLGAPAAPVIGLIGDGAAQFTLGELASAVEAGVNVIFLIWNNSGYGEIRRFMEEGNIEKIGVDIHTPQFGPLAEGLGCAYERAEDHDDLTEALQRAQERQGPSVIEVMQADFSEGYPAL